MDGGGLRRKYFEEAEENQNVIVAESISSPPNLSLEDIIIPKEGSALEKAAFFGLSKVDLPLGLSYLFLDINSPKAVSPYYGAANPLIYQVFDDAKIMPYFTPYDIKNFIVAYKALLIYAPTQSKSPIITISSKNSIIYSPASVAVLEYRLDSLVPNVTSSSSNFELPESEFQGSQSVASAKISTSLLNQLQFGVDIIKNAQIFNTTVPYAFDTVQLAQPKQYTKKSERVPALDLIVDITPVNPALVTQPTLYHLQVNYKTIMASQTDQANESQYQGLELDVRLRTIADGKTQYNTQGRYYNKSNVFYDVHASQTRTSSSSTHDYQNSSLKFNETAIQNKDIERRIADTRYTSSTSLLPITQYHPILTIKYEKTGKTDSEVEENELENKKVYAKKPKASRKIEDSSRDIEENDEQKQRSGFKAYKKADGDKPHQYKTDDHEDKNKSKYDDENSLDSLSLVGEFAGAALGLGAIGLVGAAAKVISLFKKESNEVNISTQTVQEPVSIDDVIDIPIPEQQQDLAFDKDITDYLSSWIQGIYQLGFNSVSISLRKNTTNQYFGYEDKKPKPSPSENKLAIAFVAQYMIQQGLLDPKKPVEFNPEDKEIFLEREAQDYPELKTKQNVKYTDALKFMIEDSVNTYTNLVLKFIGEGNIWEGIRRVANVLKTMELDDIKVEVPYNRIFEYEKNTSTAETMDRLMGYILNVKYLDQDHLSPIKTHMEKEKHLEWLRAMLPGIKTGTKVTMIKRGTGFAAYLGDYRVAILLNDSREPLYSERATTAGTIRNFGTPAYSKIMEEFWKLTRFFGEKLFGINYEANKKAA